VSYYENRIKALEARIEEMALLNRMKAVRVEAQILDRIVELKKENNRLIAAGDALAYAARHQMAYEAELEGWRAAKDPTPLP
jgi:diphthamide biosynthesis methyltransferase